MKLVVISPEGDDPREHAVLADLFSAGLERYHVRKPAWSHAKLETWLRPLPRDWRARLVLHQHHDLVAALGLGGRHWRDVGGGSDAPPVQPSTVGGRTALPGSITSRSCHELSSLRAALGRYDSVFFGPVFPSISKPGHGPRPEMPVSELSALLDSRTAAARRTRVLALGGITVETALRALALGFDGVAVLGTIWQAADPLHAFTRLQNSLACHAA